MLYGMSQLRHGIGRGSLEECENIKKILTNIALHIYLQ